MGSSDVIEILTGVESLNVTESNARKPAGTNTQEDRELSRQVLSDENGERSSALDSKICSKQIKPRDSIANVVNTTSAECTSDIGRGESGAGNLHAMDDELETMKAQEVPAQSRPLCSPKSARRHSQDSRPLHDVNSLSSSPTLCHAGEKKSPTSSTTPKTLAQPQDPRTEGQAHSSKNPSSTTAKARKPHPVKRPTPSPFYIQQAERPARSRLDHCRALMVVLDLNGTLLHRQSKGGTNAFTVRPNVDTFLDYLFENHKVMVWASSQPANVGMICERLFKPEQLDHIIAIWARDKLRLPAKLYNAKVQVYKQLSWIWEDQTIQAKEPFQKWSQSNTVLIDDNLEKGASEPYNVIQLESFEATDKQMEDTNSFDQLIAYLEVLKWQQDVSVYMRTQPYLSRSSRANGTSFEPVSG